MANEDTGAELEQPRGEVPEEVAEDIQTLAMDASEMARKTARGWKISAAIFAALLIFIAAYLGFFYNVFRKSAEPGILVAMALGPVNNLLERVDAPKLHNPMLAQWAVEQLNQRAPELVRQRLKPRLIELQEKLPQLRKDALQKFEEQAPERFDAAVEFIETTGLPRIGDLVTRTAKERADIAMDNLEGQLEGMVAAVVERHQEDLATLEEDQMAKLQATLEEELEAEYGPVLDEVFVRIERSIINVEAGMEDLVDVYKRGTMTEQEALKVQLIRVVYALFQRTEIRPEDVELSLELE